MMNVSTAPTTAATHAATRRTRLCATVTAAFDVSYAPCPTTNSCRFFIPRVDGSLKSHIRWGNTNMPVCRSDLVGLHRPSSDPHRGGLCQRCKEHLWRSRPTIPVLVEERAAGAREGEAASCEAVVRSWASSSKLYSTVWANGPPAGNSSASVRYRAFCKPARTPLSGCETALPMAKASSGGRRRRRRPVTDSPECSTGDAQRAGSLLTAHDYPRAAGRQQVTRRAVAQRRSRAALDVLPSPWHLQTLSPRA